MAKKDEVVNNGKVATRKHVEDRIQALFDKMEEAKTKGQQLVMGLPDEQESDVDAKIEQALLGDEPTRGDRYNLVYVILSLLKKNLPPGEMHKEGRNTVREEIRLYLNEGKRKVKGKPVGADMRQAPLPRLRIAQSMLEKWVNEGASPWNVYLEFRALNEGLGYHKDRYAAPLKKKGTPSQ